ncbi:23S rRNA pseudouridine(2604) synthase RluF [Clostridium algidicarnis]|uniref:23S rRNA pseudouridine(2604) synthase RluF n=1 Tax=Clostridium algidicarnis TaxID=37659 RepID=UPI001C0BA6B2|nr:23S rRNA pseudouridine(2604) synthase RluF [Clostridium algidicarnis]MBU3209909.1 23S rRNA pseudouridine(2604) synthase RluF [Clostridium algidicarnis]MBU3228447.1 23S rRNA pseudouridine(2604) synthase RluF [Clostridium algidicarnis]MBU3252190.1 23S rRNA pseudouridine(2604) synthase RluF [Clostridium algidicarnis]
MKTSTNTNLTKHTSNKKKNSPNKNTPNNNKKIHSKPSKNEDIKKDSLTPSYIVHDTKDSIRINKFISDSGYCSRREADRLIESGRVTVDGIKAVIGTKVSTYQEVYVDKKLINEKEKPIYIALNKPVGITCTTEPWVKGNIVDFVAHPKRIFHIGRLDKDSEGLIFLTNDGDIVNKILRAENNHEKEYIVTVDKPISRNFIEKMSSGVNILDTITKKCKVTREGTYVFRIILTQGLNRQIRRMCSALGYNVVKLQRIRIMNVTLHNLPLGKWRYLTPSELITINKLIS